MDKYQWLELFEWMALINFFLLILMSLLVVVLRGWMTRLHGHLFQLTPAQVMQAVYAWLGQYKLFLIMFNIVPYVALRLL